MPLRGHLALVVLRQFGGGLLGLLLASLVRRWVTDPLVLMRLGLTAWTKA